MAHCTALAVVVTYRAPSSISAQTCEDFRRAETEFGDPSQVLPHRL